MAEFNAFVEVLRWLFRAGAICLLAFGAMQFYSGTGEDGQGSDKRNGAFKVLGGVGLYIFGEVVASGLTAPSI